MRYPDALGAALTPVGQKPSPWDWRPELLSIPRPDVLFSHWEGGGPPRCLVNGWQGTMAGTTGDPIWEVKHEGIGLSFVEAEERYYTVPAMNGFAYGEYFTIAICFRCPNMGTGAAFKYFFSHGTFASEPSINLFFEESSTDIYQWIEDADGSVFNSTVGTEFTSDSEYHLLEYKISPTRIRVIVDGTERANRAINSGVWSGATISADLYIGIREDLNNVRRYDGQIAWWGIWNREVTLPTNRYASLRPDPAKVLPLFFPTAAGGGGATPKGPFGHPFHGPFAGPIGYA